MKGGETYLQLRLVYDHRENTFQKFNRS